MLSRYNAIDIEHLLRETSPASPFPPADNRTAWEEIRRSLGEEQVKEVIGQAEASVKSSIPALSATLFLEFARHGQREGYESHRSRRREMLQALTLAECLEGRGRFLDPLLDVAWAICEESSWALPAHQGSLTDMEHPVIDLGVAMTGLELAEMDLLLGNQLDPWLGQRIRYEVDRRCFTPYLTRHDFWWLYNTEYRRVNNWTAVCNSGVVGAALYLEPDLARLAEMIARAARSLDDYLATFDPDGGSSEGPGYWSYGFGFYTILAHLLAHRTDGGIDFLKGEFFTKTARYPLATVLSCGRYVNFSDCDRKVGFLAPHLAFLSRRLELPELMPLAREQPLHKREQSLTWALRSLFWQPTAEPAGPSRPARHNWFSGMMWMLARFDPTDPNALVLAAKGGHNGEMHNQNDVGNIIVHLGGESVIADVGRGRYTKAYFGPERYEHFVNASTGHSVPLPNGQSQLPGEAYRAELLRHRTGDDADVLALELKDAYPPEAALASLTRTVTLHREAPRGWVELVDKVRFANRPGTCESRLTTFAAVEIGQDTVLLRGEKGALRIYFDGGVVSPRVEVVRGVDLAEGPADVNLVIFTMNRLAQDATVQLRIEPA